MPASQTRTETVTSIIIPQFLICPASGTRTTPAQSEAAKKISHLLYELGKINIASVPDNIIRGPETPITLAQAMSVMDTCIATKKQPFNQAMKTAQNIMNSLETNTGDWLNYKIFLFISVMPVNRNGSLKAFRQNAGYEKKAKEIRKKIGQATPAFSTSPFIAIPPADKNLITEIVQDAITLENAIETLNALNDTGMPTEILSAHNDKGTTFWIVPESHSAEGPYFLTQDICQKNTQLGSILPFKHAPHNIRDVHFDSITELTAEIAQTPILTRH